MRLQAKLHLISPRREERNLIKIIKKNPCDFRKREAGSEKKENDVDGNKTGGLIKRNA